MKRRALLSGLLAMVCLALFWGLWAQRRELARLHAEQQASMPPAAGAVQPTGVSVAATSGPDLVVTPELLRLRNQVAQLTRRRGELEGVRAENERLRAQLGFWGTNGAPPPPGYLRTSEARMAGFNTPEDTLQTFLWAMRNRDITNLVQTLTPDCAREYLRTAALALRSRGSVFHDIPPGVRVVGRTQDPTDGSIGLQVEFLPDQPPITFPFLQTNGQWKLDFSRLKPPQASK